MLIVQKYGGTSVGTLERIDEVAKRVIANKKEGHSLVVVVSAMSGVTNQLIEYAEYFAKTAPQNHDMDMLLSSGERVTSALLSIALNSKGCPAVSLSGRGAGITTDASATKARIKSIDTKNIDAMFVLARAYYCTYEFEKSAAVYDRIIATSKVEETRATAEANKKTVLDAAITE